MRKEITAVRRRSLRVFQSYQTLSSSYSGFLWKQLTFSASVRVARPSSGGETVLELRREPLVETSASRSLLATLALKAEAILGYSGLRKKLGIELPSLAQTLNDLGIEPFRTEDVKRYKEEKARQVEHQILSDYRQLARHRNELPIGSYVRARWERVPLPAFEGEVPEFALSHALEIKDKMPTATFEVEELRVEKRYDPFLIASCGKERYYIDVWDEHSFEARNV
jgi:hypothetical protein